VIIFGWGKGRPKDLGPALPFECPRCHNVVFARYFIVTKWFSLFFVPLVPYSSRHLLVCPICTYSVALETKPERDRAAKLVELTSQMRAGTISEQTYGEMIGAEVGGSIPRPAAALPPPPPARPD
jgi:hypothetical protein